MAGLHIRLDVNYPDDDKIVAVSPLAELLYVRCLCLAKRLQTDGVVSAVQVRRMGVDLEQPGLEDELVGAGLWARDEAGFVIAAWLTHNPSKAELDAARESDARRKRLRSESARNPAGRAEDIRPESNRTLTSESESESEGESDSRGSRLPKSFALDAGLRAWATKNTPTIDVEREFEQFCDYWRAKPGAGGVKRDWPATWRSWMRNQVKYQRANGRAPAVSVPGSWEPGP